MVTPSSNMSRLKLACSVPSVRWCVFKMKSLAGDARGALAVLKEVQRQLEEGERACVALPNLRQDGCISPGE